MCKFPERAALGLVVCVWFKSTETKPIVCFFFSQNSHAQRGLELKYFI